jgi:hypothetical protein
MKESAVELSAKELIEGLSTKQQLFKLEAFIVDLPAVETTLSHQFEDGIYMRELTIPAGTLCTSMTHKTNNLFFIFFGEMLVWDEKDKWDHITAFHRGRTKKGTKRIIYTLENTLWVTVHPNPDNCRDIEVLEHRLYENNDNTFITLPQLKQVQK